uniref:Uncharacterized protein n=1 Tax=Rhizophora mucronata TaxID=61149 RepID=A0A2P2MEN4_RHIMU
MHNIVNSISFYVFESLCHQINRENPVKFLNFLFFHFFFLNLHIFIYIIFECL